MFVFPLLSLSLAQRRVWLGEATKSGAAMAAPAAPAPTALVCHRKLENIEELKLKLKLRCVRAESNHCSGMQSLVIVLACT